VTKFAKNEVTEDVKEGLSVYSKELAMSHDKLCVIDEDGVTFTSHRDGSLHRFTAERSIEIQHAIGADIIVAFDDAHRPQQIRIPEGSHGTHAPMGKALHSCTQTKLWSAQEAGSLWRGTGGRHLDLRATSAQTLSDMDFDGFGIAVHSQKKTLASHSIS